MKFAALAIFTLALAGTALGQLERDRLCLTGLPVTPGFSIEAIEGIWYEVGRYNLKFVAECTAHEFIDRSNDLVDYTMYYINLNTDTAHSSSAAGITNSTEGVITLDMADHPSLDLQFLHSDWDTFAILYSCVQTGAATSTEQVWVLSATPTLTAATQAEVDAYIGAYLDLPAIEHTIQDPLQCIYGVDPYKNIAHKNVAYKGL